MFGVRPSGRIVAQPGATIRTAVPGSVSSGGGATHQIIMSQASPIPTATSSVATGSPTVQAVPTAGRQQIVVATTQGHAGGVAVTSAAGVVATTASVGATAGPQVTRQIVMCAPGGSATAAGLRSGQILQVTGQGGQQHQIVVSQSGQIILNPSGGTTKPQ